MQDFIMPSAEARAASPELDRVCREMEAQDGARKAAESRNASLRDSLEAMSAWVEAALECTNWAWDPGQHAAAKDCLDDACGLLSDPSHGDLAARVQMRRMDRAMRHLRIAMGSEESSGELDAHADHDRTCGLPMDDRASEKKPLGESLDRMRRDARIAAFDDAASCIENKHAKITAEGRDARAPGMADAAKLVRNMAFIEEGGA